MQYVFGDYTLDVQHEELRAAERVVRLDHQVFVVLACLVQHHDRVVVRQELFEQLWPDRLVTDAALERCIAVARRAVGDNGRAQRVIKTIHGRGYRFVAPVEERLDAPPSAPPLATPPLEPLTETSPPMAMPGTKPPLSPSEAPEPPLSLALGAPQQRAAAAERRVLTVLYCELFDPQASHRDLEEVQGIVQDYHTACTEIIRAQEGYVAQYLRDAVIAYFGVPQAHDDDAQRSIRAGLRLCDALRARGAAWATGPVAVRVGIHTGLVVVGEGGPERPGLLAVGETPAIAARLTALTAPGTVLISAATARLVEGYFTWQAWEMPYPAEESARGAHQVLEESGAQSRFEVVTQRGLTPFMGREAELSLLHARWAEATDGLGQVVLMTGEPGIGKSRLVQHFQPQIVVPQRHIMWRCSPSAQQSPLHPVITHFHRLLGGRSDDTPEEKLHTLEAVLAAVGLELPDMVPLMASLLSLPLPPRYPPLTLSPQRQRQKTLEALLTWLLAEAARQPVLFIVEDLQWVDPSTLEFLTLLLDLGPTARLLTLLTCRPEFQSPWGFRAHCTPLTLPRLPRPQVTQMIGGVAGGKALPSEVVNQVVAKTDGVPLFVEELTKMVLESDLLREGEERYELTSASPPLAIPATLYDSLMARLDRLATVKGVAQLGAVIGRTFAYDLLQPVASLDNATLQQSLRRLVEAELVYQRGVPPQATYTFKHALIQDAAYQSLLKSTRQQYHRHIAQVLEERFSDLVETQPELLAQHYSEAGLNEQAIVWWQRAGQRALQRSANLEAVQHLTTGLALLAALPETLARAQQELDLQSLLGPALMATKGFAAPEVEQTYARARALCTQVGETPQLVQTLRGLGRFYQSRVALLPSRELGEQLYRLAQQAAVPTRLLEAHDAFGVILFLLGDYAAARTHLEQGIALIDPRAERDLALRHGAAPGMRCLIVVADTLWCLGYPVQAMRRCEEALSRTQELANLQTLVMAQHWANYLHHRCRDVLAVQEQAETLLALATEQGFPLFVAYAKCWLGWVLSRQGQGEAGLEQMRQSLAAILNMGQAVTQPLCLILMAEAMGQAGQIAEGLHLLGEARAVMAEGGRGDLLAEAYRLQGEFLLRQVVPDAAQAEASLQQALAIARRQQAKSWELRAAMSLSRLWRQHGKRAEAHELLAPIYGWFTEGFDTADLQEAKALLEELA